MSFFSSISEKAGFHEAWKMNKAAAKAWVDFDKALMTGSSSFSDADMRLIAAYASAMNGCNAAFEEYSQQAVALGANQTLFDNIHVEPADAPVDDKWKPLLTYIRKLCRDPHRLVQREADAIFDAGWSEMAFTEAVDICALVKYGNLVLFGHGVAGVSDQSSAAA